MIVVQLGKNYKEEEILAIASDPDCTHLDYLENYDELESLSYLLQKQICESKYFSRIQQ